MGGANGLQIYWQILTTWWKKNINWNGLWANKPKPSPYKFVTTKIKKILLAPLDDSKFDLSLSTFKRVSA